MDFQEFLIGQEKIYNRFRDRSKIESEGTKPNVPKSVGGYLITLKHSEEITREVEKFSKRVANCVPAINYDFDSVHTSISDLGIEENFLAKEKVLRTLCECVREVVAKKQVIVYSEYLYNQDSVIAAGTPNRFFIELAQEIYASAERRGIKLRLPWGAHITVNRFKEGRSPEELKDFFKLMREAPAFGESVPNNIDVSYFNFSPKEFSLKVYERFNL